MLYGGYFMYNEKKLKFWAICQIVKKWFIILLFSIFGTALGFVISEFVIDVLNEIVMYRVALIAGATFLGFFMGLLLTANTNSNIQDAYWKIEVMKKINIISDKLGKVEIKDLTVVNNNHHKINNTKSTTELSNAVKNEINTSK